VPGELNSAAERHEEDEQGQHAESGHRQNRPRDGDGLNLDNVELHHGPGEGQKAFMAVVWPRRGRGEGRWTAECIRGKPGC